MIELSLLELWDEFKLPVFMSLIGALIGHYSKNGVIELPIFNIPDYKKGSFLEHAHWSLKPFRVIYIVLDYLIFLLGIRTKRNHDSESAYVDLGFFGDMLIGIGTGILAKSALSLSNTSNEFALISTALLSGYAGLSYIKSRQHQDFRGQVGDLSKQYATLQYDQSIKETATSTGDSKAKQG